MESVSTHATNLVGQLLDYDTLYVKTAMDTAITDRKGVCFHYVRILRDALEKCGLQTEILYGDMLDGMENTTHVWLRIFDAENGKWIYRDPTRASAVDIYEIYAEYYRQEGIA